jgi:2-keto-3-deoxy-L-fuconate dehydrogenase
VAVLPSAPRGVIVVTGGASGIGAATCRALADGGATVAVVDRDADAAGRVGGEVGGRGYHCEVSDRAAVVDTAARIVDELGPVHGLVTAAGISRGGSTESVAEDSWDEVFAVNVKGTLFWMQAVIPAMRERRSGAIVTISSQLARAGGTHNSAYIASKAAVLGLTRTTALELAGSGIRVNTVLPGATETPLLEAGMARTRDPEAAKERSRSRHAMGRFGRPEEIAAAIVFLLSDGAGFMTGSEVVVDGGWLVA